MGIARATTPTFTLKFTEEELDLTTANNVYATFEQDGINFTKTGTGYGTENTSWSYNCQSNHLSNVSLTANQKLSVYARGRTGSYYTFAPMLVIIEA